MKKGFTLIELLVVVLIIGILSAIALPQYQRAVAKARLSQLYTLGNAVVQAQERYYLANSRYTTNWTELDIDFTGTVNGRNLTNPAGWSLFLYDFVEGGHWESVRASDSRLPDGMYLVFSFVHAQAHSGKGLCFAPQNSTLADSLCKNISIDGERKTQSPYYWYFF